MMMRERLIAFMMTLFFTVVLCAATYKVSVQSTLNLRAEPSTTAAVIQKLPDGAVVEADEKWQDGDDRWVKVVYDGEQEGYVKASYLQPLQRGVDDRGKHWYELLDWSGDGYQYLAYVILALTLVMWAELKFVRRMPTDFITDDDDDGCGRWVGINSVLLLATSFLIFYYLAQMGRNAMWFITPRLYSSWVYVAINFVFLVYALINLLVCFLKTFVDISFICGTRIDLRIGLVSWLVGIALLIVLSVFSRNDPMYVYYGLALMQLVQVALIIYRSARSGHTLLGVCSAVLYVVVSAAIMLLASVVVFVIMAVTVVGFIIYAMMRGSQTSPGSVHCGPYEYYGNETPYGSGNYNISTPGGNVYATSSDGYIYHGSDGVTYRKVGSNSFEPTRT